VAKKVVDNKMSVMLRSLRSLSSIWIFHSIGVGEPKHAYLRKKGEGKMTKRNLLLVSLLLVAGLAALAPSLLAQTTWSVTVTPTPVPTIRKEGDAEGVGTLNLNVTSAGTLQSGSYITITYNAPLAYNGSYYAVEVTPSATLSTNIKVTEPSASSVKITFTANVAVTTSDFLDVAVRLQAQGLAYSAAVQATSITAGGYTASYKITLPTTGAPWTVAHVGAKQALTIAFKEGPAQVLSCLGALKVPTYSNEFSLRLTENWAMALTDMTDETALETDTDTGAPTNASNILITLANIPTGAHIEVGTVYTCSEYPSGPHGCPGATVSGVFVPDQLDISYTSETAVTAGSQSFFYMVNTSTGPTPKNAVFHFRIWSGALPAGLPSVTATVSLTDASPSTAPLDMPYFTASETPVLSVADFSDCVTNLLFPYVNTFMAGGTAAFANFGTGIDFANTTMDPFGTSSVPSVAAGSAVPQNGSCTVYLYPANVSVGTQVFTTANIPSGGSWAFDVASAVPGFAGNTGYAIAVCDFQNAYGFAEIYDNYGIGAPTATLGYEAYILPNPGLYPRSPAGDSLGESAIAPIDLNKKWEKYYITSQPQQ
jgi:hypothetical protein